MGGLETEAVAAVRNITGGCIHWSPEHHTAGVLQVTVIAAGLGVVGISAAAGVV